MVDDLVAWVLQMEWCHDHQHILQACNNLMSQANYFSPMQLKLSELWEFGDRNTFQNQSVSSPAPLTMVCPSGEIARYNTLYVWPVKVASLDIVGYLQTIIWFWEYPWVLTSSFTFFDHTRLQTLDMCTPRLLWAPEHLMQMKTPKVIDLTSDSNTTASPCSVQRFLDCELSKILQGLQTFYPHFTGMWKHVSGHQLFFFQNYIMW